MANTCPKCNADNPDTLKFCGECGTQLPSIEKIEVTETLETLKEELTTGSTFAERYQIIEELGKGGMGRVYKVLDKETNEKIALKLIKPEIAADKKTVERFRNELTTARKIAQKNVCRMYDLGKEKGSYFITMEYISGQDLKGLIRQTGQLTIGKAISIAKQICDGLAEAHSLGVVHRDLKPNNIMIDQGGNAKIMDFGIARAVKGKGITGSGVMIGTPQYMSPEQVEGKEVDQRSDLYSVGIILYEMLTDRVPFEGDTPLTVGVKQKTEKPKDPKVFNERIPDDLSQLILKCLEKDRENRYKNAAEMRSDLDKIEQGLPTTDRVIPKKKTLTSHEFTVQFNLKKLLIPILAVIALIVIGLVIWSPWGQKKATLPLQDKPFLAVLYFENNTGDENLDQWKRGLSQSIITDISQSKYIQVLSSDRLLSILRKINKLDSTDYATEDLKAIADESGANYILLGRLYKSGETYRIEYTLHDIQRGGIAGSDRVEGQGEDNLLIMVDDLTLKVKKNFNISEEQLKDDVDRELWRISTAKPEAYKYYIEAQTLDNLGNYPQTLALLEKAIEIDPEFAMAHRLIGAVNQNAGNSEERDIHLTKAYELRDRVPEVEKRWITADYLKLVEQDSDRAIDAYHTLFELAPNHPIGHFNLGGLYSRLGDTDRTIEHLEISRQNLQNFFPMIRLLGDNYEEKKMYEKAREVYQDYLDNVQDIPLMHVLIAHAYYYEGKYDEAIVEIEKANALVPDSDSKDRIYHLQGDYEAAEEGYRNWLEKESLGWKMNGRRNLEILYRTLGQYKKAREEAEAGLKYALDINDRYWPRFFWDLMAIEDLMTGDLDGVLEWTEKIQESSAEDEASGWQPEILWLKMMVELEQNDIEGALELAEEVKEYVDSTPNTKDISRYYSCMGYIEMRKQNYKEAIDFFVQSYELLGGQRTWLQPHAIVLYSLASAYFQNGDLATAQKEYENILALTTGRIVWGDLYVKSYYQLGKIHEAQGNNSKAIEHYEKFLTLWKDADPGIAEVQDARKRLAGLK